MGSKFAHFSILHSTVGETIEILKSVSQNGKALYPDYDRILDSLKSQAKANKPDLNESNLKFLEQLKQMIAEHDESNKTFFVGTNGDWVTVFQDDSGNSARENVVKLSRHSPGIFLFVSNFDDDIFELSIFKNGKSLTKHVSGAAEAYGYAEETSPGDIEIIADTFNVTDKKEELKHILENDDVFQKIPELEKSLSMKLWINDPAELEKLGWEKVII